MFSGSRARRNSRDRSRSASRSRSRSLSGSFRRASSALVGGGGSGSGMPAGAVETISAEPLRCTINLANGKLVLGAGGSWELDEEDGLRQQSQSKRLTAVVEKQQRDAVEREERLERAQEERALLEFQNKILIELLAAAQLDAERNNEEWQKEELKTQALRWELANTNLEVYRLRKMQRAAATPVSATIDDKRAVDTAY